jgi:hypothetical protein
LNGRAPETGTGGGPPVAEAHPESPDASGAETCDGCGQAVAACACTPLSAVIAEDDLLWAWDGWDPELPMAA